MKNNFDLVLNHETYASARVLVAGDLILDRYILGITDRTSPEAPVPVVRFTGQDDRAGGAANVAINVISTGARCVCMGRAGDDSEGEILIGLLDAQCVDTGFISRDVAVPTVSKTRVISQGQQIVRIDREVNQEGDEAAQDEAREKFGAALAGCNALVLSDYGKGYLSKNFIANAVAVCREKSVSVFVDPKGRDYAKYRGVTVLTPNAKEAYEATGIATDSVEGLQAAMERLVEIVECELLIITRGAEGLAWWSREGGFQLVSAKAREVYDVTGAGDTFVAWLACGKGAGLPWKDCIDFANAAAGVSVASMGTAAVSVAAVRAAILPEGVDRKRYQPEAAGALANELRGRGKRIIFTNGCFDFLHSGHVQFLMEARALGDVLFVGMNSDGAIRELKGEGRPYISQDQRETLLAGIHAVDYLVPFDEETPHRLLKLIRPDVLVKGGNFALSEVEGADLVREYGGEVRTLPIQLEVSTSRLLGGK